MPPSRAAINPGTSQWRGCSVTVRPQVEARAGVAARSVPSTWHSAKQEVDEVKPGRGRHVEESFHVAQSALVFENMSPHATASCGIRAPM
jgi:hypothetical protein